MGVDGLWVPFKLVIEIMDVLDIRGRTAGLCLSRIFISFLSLFGSLHVVIPYGTIYAIILKSILEIPNC